MTGEYHLFDPALERTVIGNAHHDIGHAPANYRALPNVVAQIRLKVLARGDKAEPCLNAQIFGNDARDVDIHAARLACVLPTIGRIIFIDRECHVALILDRIHILTHKIAARVLRLWLRDMIRAGVSGLGLRRKKQAQRQGKSGT